MDRLFDTYGELLPTQIRTTSASAYPKERAGLRLRLPPGHPGQGLRRRSAASCRRRRCRTSASTAPARASRRCCCACAPTRCPRRATYADLMLDRAAQGDPALPAAGSTCPTAAWRGATTCRRHRQAMETAAYELLPGDEVDAAVGPTVTLVDFDPDGEVKAHRRDALPPHRPARDPDRSAGCARMGTDDRVAVRAGLRRRAHQPPPQARPGLRAHRLPLRRALRLRRLPRPAAPPHAHHRVAAAHAPPRLHPSRAVDEPGLAERFDEAMATLGRRSGTTLCRADSRSRPPTPCRWRTASAT